MKYLYLILVKNENSSHDFQASRPLGPQPQRKTKYSTAIVPHNAMADSLMEDISLFVEENTDAEIIDEEREIR